MTPTEIASAFKDRFGAEPEVLAIAPGRINLIGEHTDYNDGFVFPAAIDRVTYVAASRSESESHLFSLQVGEAAAFDVQSVEPNQLGDWGKYPAGMGWALREAGHQVSNINAVVSSNIPMGSGVSSSAALEMAFGVVWNQFGELGISPSDMAGLGKVCENKFVGVNSGIMDQMASAMGKLNRAMFLDTRTLQIEYAPIPSELVVVLCDTKKPRALTDSAYNERRSQCETAAAVMGVKALRDADMTMLDAHKEQLSEVVYRRAKHVITENARCIAFKEALEKSDLPSVGELMKGSHVSLRDDYEVSCKELDLMAEAAWAAPGCVGARMTGAGFGGACVSLVFAEQLPQFQQSLLENYNSASGLKGEAIACTVVEGARSL